MACPRCHIRPVGMLDGGRAVAYLTGGISHDALDVRHDPRLPDFLYFVPWENRAAEPSSRQSERAVEPPSRGSVEPSEPSSHRALEPSSPSFERATIELVAAHQTVDDDGTLVSGAVVARDPSVHPPVGFEAPRICSLCGVVYYPRKASG